MDSMKLLGRETGYNTLVLFPVAYQTLVSNSAICSDEHVVLENRKLS